MVTKGWQLDRLMTEAASVVLVPWALHGARFAVVLGVLGYRGRGKVEAFSPCSTLAVGLRPKSGLGGLVWEPVDLGPRGTLLGDRDPPWGRVIESIRALARGHLIMRRAMPLWGLR